MPTFFRILCAAGALILVAFAVSAATDGSGSSAPAAPAASTSASPSTTTAAACSSAKPLGAGDRTIRVRVGNVWREAYVSVPRGALGHAAPLVVGFHGLRGWGQFMSDWTGLSKVAARNGFIAAYPTATKPKLAWAIQPNAQNQDVAFVRALMADVARRWCVDSRRVSAVGISNGGGFAARVACDLADRLAAVVLVAPALTQARDCTSGPPVSVLEIHGTSDPIAPYRSKNGSKAVLDWLQDWRVRDGCGSRAAKRTQVRSIVSRIAWSPCAKGTSVEHLRITGGRHQWPGSSPSNPGPTSGLSASEETWRFAASRRSQAPAF
jgi:polyhydroxybutyrate depolymerase